MTVTCSIYKAEKQRVAVDEWAARDLRCLLLDTTSTYVFNETDLYDDRDAALSNAIAECNQIIAAAEERKATLGIFDESH